MTKAWDPEIAPVMESMIEAARQATPPTDAAGVRAVVDPTLMAIASLSPAFEEVEVSDVTTARADGSPLAMRAYRRSASKPATVVVFAHGGGRIAGTVETSDRSCRRLASDADVVVVSVEYRLAPEHPGLAACEDVRDALAWVAEHRGEVGAAGEGPLVIGGDSAGGGIAAGVALMVRDGGGPAIDLQLLIYPMIDDRTVAAPALDGLMTWTPELNVIGWGAALGDGGEAAVSPYLAPARADDLSSLPPAYLEIGDLDLFLDETLAYASRLSGAGVPVELTVYRGMPHGGENLAPDSAVSRRMFGARQRALSELGG